MGADMNQIFLLWLFFIWKYISFSSACFSQPELAGFSSQKDCNFFHQCPQHLHLPQTKNKQINKHQQIRELTIQLLFPIMDSIKSSCFCSLSSNHPLYFFSEFVVVVCRRFCLAEFSQSSLKVEITNYTFKYYFCCIIVVFLNLLQNANYTCYFFFAFLSFPPLSF